MQKDYNHLYSDHIEGNDKDISEADDDEFVDVETIYPYNYTSKHNKVIETKTTIT